ncbi:MAG: hypothetical protein LUE24_05115 [Lachnospiraceae bacterium]|nr:hypothetical protein [Lachnospiraceae bacterium]
MGAGGVGHLRLNLCLRHRKRRAYKPDKNRRKRRMDGIIKAILVGALSVAIAVINEDGGES